MSVKQICIKLITHFCLVDCPVHEFDIYLRGLFFVVFHLFSSEEIPAFKANSEDPDLTLHSAPFVKTPFWWDATI